jgi:hypothetical protein
MRHAPAPFWQEQMPEWKRFSSSAGRFGVAALVLAPVACSLGDFDSLGAGVDQNIGDGAGSGGSAGSAGSGAGGTSGSGGTSDGGSAGAGGSSGSTGNLIPNGDFDRGATSWACVGNCATALSEGNPRSGTHCLLTTNRTQVWEGPSLSLIGKVTPGETYRISLWVRSEPSGEPDGGLPDSFSIGLTQKRVCASTDPPDGTFSQLSAGTATSEWTEQTAVFVAPDCVDLQDSSVYLERAPVGASYCIDDTSLVLVP